jgi:hypothetical protein
MSIYLVAFDGAIGLVVGAAAWETKNDFSKQESDK